jgi:hypothetical protein
MDRVAYDYEPVIRCNHHRRNNWNFATRNVLDLRSTKPPTDLFPRRRAGGGGTLHRGWGCQNQVPFQIPEEREVPASPPPVQILPIQSRVHRLAGFVYW